MQQLRLEPTISSTNLQEPTTAPDTNSRQRRDTLDFIPKTPEIIIQLVRRVLDKINESLYNMDDIPSYARVCVLLNEKW